MFVILTYRSIQGNKEADALGKAATLCTMIGPEQIVPDLQGHSRYSPPTNNNEHVIKINFIFDLLFQ